MKHLPIRAQGENITMARIFVLNHVSLDGVMQAPASPDEDPRNGFRHGGWAMPRGAALGLDARPPETIGGLLFGRRTYESFYAYWPKQTDSPFTDLLNMMPKYVASRTLTDPLPWQNSTHLPGDAASAVAALKTRVEQDLLIMGSGDLIRCLTAHALIDVYILMIHPIVLGSGQTLFGVGGPRLDLNLTLARPAAGGVVIATYERAMV